MNFKSIRERLAKWLSNNNRSLAERADELTNLLGKFLPRQLAVAITAEVFHVSPGFDIKSKESEYALYLLKQAAKDFLDNVAWIESNIGLDASRHWVRAVRSGQELFFPPYLQGTFGVLINSDHRGGGRARYQ